MSYVESNDFKNVDYTTTPLPKGEYENCRFLDCNFNNTDLSHISFVECFFKNCDMSMVNLNQTALKEVEFINCRLLGVQFNNCSPFLFSITLDSCYMNLACFYNLNLKNTVFTNCSLQESDFAEANLTGAAMPNCDLTNAIFDGTVLEKADLSTAYGFIIDPEKNKVKGARISLQGLPGLVARYGITIS